MTHQIRKGGRGKITEICETSTHQSSILLPVYSSARGVGGTQSKHNFNYLSHFPVGSGPLNPHIDALMFQLHSSWEASTRSTTGVAKAERSIPHPQQALSPLSGDFPAWAIPHTELFLPDHQKRDSACLVGVMGIWDTAGTHQGSTVKHSAQQHGYIWTI